MERFDIHISVHKSILTITCCPLIFSIGIVNLKVFTKVCSSGGLG